MKVKVAQSCLTLCDFMDYTVHGIPQATILEWVALPVSRKGIFLKIPWRSKGSSQPRDRTQISTMQVDSLPAEPEGKPKNTGVGSLSLLQNIFSAQESNRGLLHCRQILHQLSYQRMADTKNRKRISAHIFNLKIRKVVSFKTFFFCQNIMDKGSACGNLEKLHSVLKRF